MERSNPKPRLSAVLGKWGRLAENPAVFLAGLLLLAGGYFGSSRDFGSFLLSVPIIAILILGAFIAVARAGVRKAERAAVLFACALICLAPLAYLFSYEAVQQIRFLLWAPAHYRQLSEASKKNGVVVGWDSWGMAGQDTFSYLVADTEDGLGSNARAAQWTKQIGQSCGFWEERRVWPRLYIVTTYTNCPYDGIEPAD